jgi:hypothetical protein
MLDSFTKPTGQPIQDLDWSIAELRPSTEYRFTATALNDFGEKSVQQERYKTESKAEDFDFSGQIEVVITPMDVEIKWQANQEVESGTLEVFVDESEKLVQKPAAPTKVSLSSTFNLVDLQKVLAQKAKNTNAQPTIRLTMKNARGVLKQISLKLEYVMTPQKVSTFLTQNPKLPQDQADALKHFADQAKPSRRPTISWTDVASTSLGIIAKILK